MTLLDQPITQKEFKPGTTGWTAADLDDPEIERLWFAGRYEIIEGVLTEMAPAYFSGGEGLSQLMFRLQEHVHKAGGSGGFAQEVDIVISRRRVVRADGVYLDPSTKERQRRAAIAEKRKNLRRTRILVPPTLVIENISPGHEDHDRETKRSWYAEFGIVNYWLLDVFNRSLECLVLEGAEYRVDTSGQGNSGTVQPSLFLGLTLSLAEIFVD